MKKKIKVLLCCSACAHSSVGLFKDTISLPAFSFDVVSDLFAFVCPAGTRALPHWRQTIHL